MDFIEVYERQSFPRNRRTFNNFNEPNKDSEFDLQAGDSFIHPHHVDRYIKFEVIGKYEDEPFTGNSNMKLIDNFVPYLLSQVEVRKHGTVIDRIDYLGIPSATIATLKFSKPEMEYFKAGGLITDAKRPRKDNTVLLSLRLLYGFFSDYKEIIWKGGVTFKSSNTDSLFYRGNRTKTLPYLIPPTW